MPLRSINLYLLNETRDRLIRNEYEAYVADMIYILAQRDKKAPTDIWWRDRANKLLGDEPPEDTRTAQQIVADTLMAHGVKIEK